MYLGLISIAFGLVVWAVMNITGTYLINQRVSEEMQAADDLALEVTPYVKSADADQMYSLLVQRGRENGARILILDSAGTVWVDTLSELNGVRLGHGEVTDVISQQMDRSYGFHQVEGGVTLLPGEWIGYYTSAVTDKGECIGVVMMISSLSELTHSMARIQYNIIVFFVVVLVIVMLVVFISARSSPIPSTSSTTSCSKPRARAFPFGPIPRGMTKSLSSAVPST